MAETGYLAPAGFVDELKHELGSAVRATHGRLVIAEGPPRPVAWVANIWHAPQRLTIASIGDAAKQLRAMQRSWALYPTAHHRRAKLIADKLPKVSAKPLRFGDPVPTAPLGSWTLLDVNKSSRRHAARAHFQTVKQASSRTSRRRAAPISSCGSCSP